MSLSRRRLLGALAGAMAAPAFIRSASASAWAPNRTVTLVVPYPAGGPTDAAARIVAQEIAGPLGQSVIVENMPGASGSIGSRRVAKGEPDGHLIVLGNNQTHATNIALLKDGGGYDPIKDFVPLAGIADLQHVLVVRNDFATSVEDLIRRAKAEPGKLNYGSTGPGSGSHLTMELFKVRTGTDIVHVPFRGAAPLAQEIAAGRIDCSFATLPSVLGQIQGNLMKALALASGNRSDLLPGVPMLRETGVPDAEGDSWLALFAPSGIPAAARERLSNEILAALAKPAVKEAITKQGIALNVRDSAAFAAYQANEVKKWADVARIAKVVVE
jgi:tripartite-type tricarboxylate transporter receptor subunit TctC